MLSRKRRDLKGKAEVFLYFQLTVQHVMEYGEDKEDVQGESVRFLIVKLPTWLSFGRLGTNSEIMSGEAVMPLSLNTCGQTSVYMLQHEVRTCVQASICTTCDMYISGVFLTCLVVLKDKCFWHDTMIFSDLLSI
ncbi:hypothetical protein Bca101_017741 [Brassica carinata]